MAQALARVLVLDRSYRYDVKGFLTHNPALVGTSLVNPKVLGTINQLFEISEKQEIETIAVCVEDRRG
ncbi:MAG: hypothetical protein KC592_18535, partial [Nitrospira sp.]|nr:hypothetical protein [Nitrospira sp.]